jgi:hypothetical protein
MKTVAKTALLAATAAMVAAATPAQARDHYRDNDRIDAGDVIAGALIIGGIAAIASASSNHRGYRDYDRYDRRDGDDRYDSYRDNRWNNDYGYGSRQAVDQCVRAAQRDASRYGRARVTDVTDIDRVDGGYKVRGRLVVEQRNYWGGRYNDGWNRNGYYYDRYSDGYNKGGFTCTSRYGDVQDLRLRGLGGYY